MLSAPRLFAESPGQDAGSSNDASSTLWARAVVVHDSRVSADAPEQARRAASHLPRFRGRGR